GPLSPAAPRNGVNFAGHPAVPDLTLQQAEAYDEALHTALNPDLQLGLNVDRVDATPGDVLIYTATIKNIGTGTATAAVLTNTFPDGTTASRTLPDIPANGSVVQTFTYTVPCQTADQ